LVPELSEVFHQRPYYSSDRKRNIYFDVTIEMTLPNAPNPSIIWVWECKDYTSLVPVDDVEELHAKLEQIGADNTKGTIVTKVGFQSSALEYAKSKKIGLARIVPHSQVEWILYRPDQAQRARDRQSRDDIRRALTEAEYVPTNQSFYGLTTGFRTLPQLTLERYLRLQLDEWLSPVQDDQLRIASPEDDRTGT
jgi:hypothetical protein